MPMVMEAVPMVIVMGTVMVEWRLQQLWKTSKLKSTRLTI